MAYDLPGVTLTEQRGAPTPEIPESQRIGVIVGKISPYVKVTQEAVVRSSTGYTDDLAYTSTGVYSLITVESIKGLKDYKTPRDYSLVSNQILWTSTGLIPNDGVTYYVTYYRNRLTTEYTYFECNNVQELYAKGGYPEDDLQNAILFGEVAFNIFGIPVLAVQPVKPPYSTTDYTTAVTSLSNRNVQSLYVLSTNSTVQAAAAKHVQERSLPDSKRERILWAGAVALTSVDDIVTLAETYKREEIIIVSPTRAKLTWYNYDTLADVTTTIDGAGIAAILGLYRDSFDDPSFSLLRKKLAGTFVLFEEDYDTYFVDSALIELGNAGVLQIVPFRNSFNIPLVVDELTTDPTNAKTSSIAVTTAKHYNTNSIRNGIDDTFTGQKILNPATYAQSVRNYLIGLMGKLVSKGSIAYFTEADVQVRVGKSFDGTEVNPQKVYISYAYYAVYVHKLTEGVYSLLP